MVEAAVILSFAYCFCALFLTQKEIPTKEISFCVRKSMVQLRFPRLMFPSDHGLS